MIRGKEIQFWRELSEGANCGQIARELYAKRVSSYQNNMTEDKEERNRHSLYAYTEAPTDSTTTQGNVNHGLIGPNRWTLRCSAHHITKLNFEACQTVVYMYIILIKQAKTISL